jgi:hypothetical protein
MIKVHVKKSGPFSETPCVKGFKWWGLGGNENDIMAGTYKCRCCEYHVFLPLAGQNTFGCAIKKSNGHEENK